MNDEVPDRKLDANGNLPAIGSTVDLARATWTNTIGKAEMGTVWADPEFNPLQAAFYYARVIEIPTPRWTAYDAFRLGADARSFGRGDPDPGTIYGFSTKRHRIWLGKGRLRGNSAVPLDHRLKLCPFRREQHQKVGGDQVNQ